MTIYFRFWPLGFVYDSNMSVLLVEILYSWSLEVKKRCLVMVVFRVSVGMEYP